MDGIWWFVIIFAIVMLGLSVWFGKMGAEVLSDVLAQLRKRDRL